MNTDEELMTELTSEVEVDGLAGQRIRLLSEDDDIKIAIIGVMVPRKELAWFFKFVGDKEFVGDNETAFDEFLNSFTFEQD